MENFKDACRAAFSGRGHMSSRSRHHVKFVAEVISHLMETSIFAYLGFFLFNDNSFNIKMIFSGMLSCVSSRAIMVLFVSLLINVCVFIDLEHMILGRLWYVVRRSDSRITLDDNDTFLDREKIYLDSKTQLILFSAGVRGAVSYSLVQNIPVYDAMTKQGSRFKNELRAMTSSTIFVLLFCFGALTYFTVQRDAVRSDRERVAGPLTHRLMSTGMDSEDDVSTGEHGYEASDFEREEELHQMPNRRPPTA